MTLESLPASSDRPDMTSVGPSSPLLSISLVSEISLNELLLDLDDSVEEFEMELVSK